MAFIFSDLVVFPVLRISARYFGWKMALYILGVFLASLVITALALHFSFDALGIIPSHDTAKTQQTEPAERFDIDYTFWLNLAFLAVSGIFAWLAWTKLRQKRRENDDGGEHDHDHGDTSWMQRILLVLAVVSIVWLVGGVIAWSLTR
jgi:hypothetical protein